MVQRSFDSSAVSLKKISMSMHVMEAFKFFNALFVSTVVLNINLPEVSGKDDCINQLTDLETSLLNNQGNIENLTRAFIPPNQPSPLVVRVCYYITDSTTNHTLNAQDHRDCQNASYIFHWSTTPIFLYAPVETLTALTLNLAQITQQTAVLTIDAPVCDILLLNYFSTLVRWHSIIAVIVITIVEGDTWETSLVH